MVKTNFSPPSPFLETFSEILEQTLEYFNKNSDRFSVSARLNLSGLDAKIRVLSFVSISSSFFIRIDNSCWILASLSEE